MFNVVHGVATQRMSCLVHPTAAISSYVSAITPSVQKALEYLQQATDSDEVNALMLYLQSGYPEALTREGIRQFQQEGVASVAQLATVTAPAETVYARPTKMSAVTTPASSPKAAGYARCCVRAFQLTASCWLWFEVAQTSLTNIYIISVKYVN